MKIKFIVSFILFFLISGCLPALKTTPANDKIVASAINFDVPRNMGRFYLMNGDCDVTLRKMKCARTNAIFINKKYIGGLNENDIMVVDLKPGQYEILHNYENLYELKSFGTENKPTLINIKEGQFEILQFTVIEGGGSLLTALINPFKYVVEISKDKNIIKNGNFIVPLN
jgi:hypothetical protein